MQLTASSTHLNVTNATTVKPESFIAHRHYYPRVLNAQIHPMVSFFMRMGNRRIVDRYCHLNPRVSPKFLLDLLEQPTHHLRWAGADLLCTTTATGNRRLVVVETNSCPSGNKSMPLLDENDELGGYRTVIENAFLPQLARRGNKVKGKLAVIYDKNHVEASGYAAAIADLTDEEVFLAPWPDGASDAPCRFTDGILEVRDSNGTWHTIRAAFRYVTQRPWNRIPVFTRTRILNPIIGCLAGGRNKLIASKAYEIQNGIMADEGLSITIPETIPDVSKNEVPLWVARFGGHAVIKVPYSNAGQGVYPILSDTDLDAFMDLRHTYDRFVVQSLVGNYEWSSSERAGRFYHVGTIPNRLGHIFVSDLRMSVCAGKTGMTPVAVYSRQAPLPLPRNIEDVKDPWEVLGTNLSKKSDSGDWMADTDRLLLMDRRDFNQLGLGLDDLVEAYIQTVLSVKAIDSMANSLLTTKGALRMKLFASLDEDATLLDELKNGQAHDSV
ncbi:MAG: hypothetical protein ACPGQS_09535 [Bradymonadia bacterium]